MVVPSKHMFILLLWDLSEQRNKTAVQGTLSQKAWNNGDKGGEMEGEVQKSASIGSSEVH